MTVFDSEKFIGGIEMPLSSINETNLSMKLTARIEKLVKKFCVDKKISNNGVSEILDCNAMNRLAQNLGLKVKIEELERIVLAKETPLEIINRTVSKVKSSKTVNSLQPFCERGSPEIVL